MVKEVCKQLWDLVQERRVASEAAADRSNQHRLWSLACLQFAYSGSVILHIVSSELPQKQNEIVISTS